MAVQVGEDALHLGLLGQVGGLLPRSHCFGGHRLASCHVVVIQLQVFRREHRASSLEVPLRLLVRGVDPAARALGEVGADLHALPFHLRDQLADPLGLLLHRALRSLSPLPLVYQIEINGRVESIR